MTSTKSARAQARPRSRSWYKRLKSVTINPTSSQEYPADPMRAGDQADAGAQSSTSRYGRRAPGGFKHRRHGGTSSINGGSGGAHGLPGRNECLAAVHESDGGALGAERGEEVGGGETPRQDGLG